MLSVKDLSCSRGGFPVLSGVSFDVEAGKALVLRGPNGIGKTTLLRALVGLQNATGGEISAKPEEFAFAGHADAVKSTLSVSENLEFWAQIFGGGDISQALDAFDLTALRNRSAGELSAGQKRRVGLARLVLTGPSIWALDEPTVALDKANVERFSGVVRAHLADGGTAIIATHIDLGLEATEFDLKPFKAQLPLSPENYDEAFV